MALKPKIVAFYSVSILFLLLNIYFLITKETFLMALTPVALALVLFALYRMDILLLCIAFFVPLSMQLSELIPGLPIDMSLPTEPLMFGVLLLFILKLIENKSFDQRIFKHPVSIAIYIYLGWMLLTCVTSTMPVVSIKFWLAKVWFIACFYFLGIPLFRNFKNIYRFNSLYLGGFLLVIFYTIKRHLGMGLTEQSAHFVMCPFFNDHTSYGAMLAFFLPLLTGLVFFKDKKPSVRRLAFLVWVIFIAALVLSYTRAAWVGLIAALGVWSIIKLKIRFRSLFITFLSLAVIIFVFQSQILAMLEKNDQQSSVNLAQHVSSMTNISTDASNLERLNRWDSALEMFKERPVVGWGPGTYMFQYAPFQLAHLRTIISTNSADRGNAHSEYLNPLAESGLLGMLSFILIIVGVYYIGIHVYTRSQNREVRFLILSIIAGLTSYFVHGFLNNFLDTDKASVPVWAFISIIVMLDIYNGETLNESGLHESKKTQ